MFCHRWVCFPSLAWDASLVSTVNRWVPSSPPCSWCHIGTTQPCLSAKGCFKTEKMMHLCTRVSPFNSFPFLYMWICCPSPSQSLQRDSDDASAASASPVHSSSTCPLTFVSAVVKASPVFPVSITKCKLLSILSPFFVEFWHQAVPITVWSYYVFVAVFWSFVVILVYWGRQQIKERLWYHLLLL